MAPYVSQNKVGILAKFDEKTRRIHQRIRWAHSKRLLHGSLLLFTKNNFKDIIVATVLDRDDQIMFSGVVWNIHYYLKLVFPNLL